MSLPCRENCFVLFDTHTDAMALHALFKGAGIPARISPTPHGPNLRPGCGVSLLLDPEELARARACIEENNATVAGIVTLPNRINPKRDHFC